MKHQRTSSWMGRARWWTLLALVVCSIPLLHCEPTDPTDPKKPDPNQTKELNLATTTFEPPAVAFADKGFIAGHLAKVGTVLGDGSGLYHLSNNKLDTLIDEPIVGVAPWRGQYLIAANPKQLHIFDGALEPLNLAEKLKLKETEITALAAQSEDTMWIGTKQHLWQLKHDTLNAFEDFKAIEHIFSFPGAQEVAVIADKGKLFLLKVDDKGAVASLTLPSDAPAFTRLYPSTGGTLWGLAEGKLYLREVDNDKSRWRPYVFGATDDKPDGEAIKAVTYDNTTGQIWAAGASHIFVISGDAAQQAKLPESLKEIKHMTAAGGTFWVSDGAQLHQFVRQNAENVTYEGQVSLFMKSNCLRCHAQVGPGRPLDSYEVVKQQADGIIKAIESGNMPADKEPLKDGDVNVIKRWVENNFAK